jgi:hypothetical protein
MSIGDRRSPALLAGRSAERVQRSQLSDRF